MKISDLFDGRYIKSHPEEIQNFLLKIEEPSNIKAFGNAYNKIFVYKFEQDNEKSALTYMELFLKFIFKIYKNSFAEIFNSYTQQELNYIKHTASTEYLAKILLNKLTLENYENFFNFFIFSLKPFEDLIDKIIQISDYLNEDEFENLDNSIFNYFDGIKIEDVEFRKNNQIEIYFRDADLDEEEYGPGSVIFTFKNNNWICDENDEGCAIFNNLYYKIYK